MKHWLLLLVLVAPPLPAGTTLKKDGVTRLYSTTAALEGKFAFQKGPNWLTISGAGSAAWEITAPAEADYDVSICYAGNAAGAPFSITAGSRETSGTLRSTEGVFDDPGINFERVTLPARLRLRDGPNRIVFRLTTTPAATLHFRSVELTPVSAAAVVRKEAEVARSRRANTDWFARAGYGLMFHWTSQSQPRHGAIKKYAQAVQDFDVDRFAQMVSDTGAAYVLFTVNHADPHCPAPIQSWERVHPGWTTQRDLIAELAGALARRNIRLMLYFASHTLGRMGKVSAEEYARIHEDVFSEMGARYRDKVSGYWLDGWYQSLQLYPDLPVQKIWQALKTGNRNRLVALNSWVYPVEIPWQDFWAAEIGGAIVKPAVSRYVTRGPGVGLQSQFLLFADAPWVHSKPESEMEPLNFKDDKLIDFIKATSANGGVVTINLGIFQDGAIGPEAQRMMRNVRMALRGR